MSFNLLFVGFVCNDLQWVWIKNKRPSVTGNFQNRRQNVKLRISFALLMIFVIYAQSLEKMQNRAPRI